VYITGYVTWNKVTIRHPLLRTLILYGWLISRINHKKAITPKLPSPTPPAYALIYHLFRNEGEDVVMFLPEPHLEHPPCKPVLVNPKNPTLLFDTSAVILFPPKLGPVMTSDYWTPPCHPHQPENFELRSTVSY
jgi:hypothetical protein